MNKYIIKNCDYYFDKPEANCWADQLSWCENCTDCVLKQIVKECVNSLRFSCERILAEKLLGLLDIQEVE